jgi:hypothetical protein
MIGIVFADGLDDVPFGSQVDLGYEVVLTLALYVESMQAIHAPNDDFTGPTGGTNGDIEQRLHEDLDERELAKERRRAKATQGRVEYQRRDW